MGDDPTRFTSPAGLRAFAGTAPIPRASGAFVLRQGAQGPQQKTWRRMPLVGIRHAHQIDRSPCPLRQAPRRRGPPQCRAAQPRPQAPQTSVVVPAARRTLGRSRRMAR
nr:hypothetical protein [Rhodococcus pyridinivorans]